MAEPAVRRSFEERLGFHLDPFQHRALDALDADRSVLVAAPTGAGKTVVAQYAVERALAAGGKTFYTTPIKALSNQKFADLAGRYGRDRVGLLTGDTSVNARAPVVVMTTEVLRNMLYADSSALDGLRYVVLDEVHYLQDPYRGGVWEEVIIHLPAGIGLVCLSATVSNAEELAAWIGAVRGATDTVIEDTRPVELVHLYAVSDRHADELRLVPVFVDGDDGPRPNPEAGRFDVRRPRRSSPRGRLRSRYATPWRVDMVDRLAAEAMLPAIYFIFSRAACERAVEQCTSAHVRLTTPEERAGIRAIAEAHVDPLCDADLDALGYSRWLEALEAGVAAHHAGMVPPMKEAVEEAFTQGLVKVVFATETLALGINMPARSVVVEKLSKFTGERHQSLTPGEYTQLAGRAGRRGIDDVGYSVICWSPFVTFDEVAGLARRRTDALRSSFRPNYNMAANLVRTSTPEQARHLLNLSFAQYHADRDVVILEQSLERARLRLERTSGSDRRGLEREVARLQRRITRRGDSLARRFDRVLGVLEAWGYVEGWELTPAGTLLARLYTEGDLLLAESLREGALDDLDPAETASVVSCFTYRRRGPGSDEPLPPSRWPSARVRRRFQRVRSIREDLAAAESDVRLEPTRAPDPGLTDAVHRWASGEDLADILEAEQTTGGDFVRNVKQCIDVLSQIALVAPDPRVATCADAAIDLCRRGVVAASSLAPPTGNDG